MQLTRLVLSNFRQHKRTELDFGPELLAIVGPNGSGKSTLLEAIAWALYGSQAARGTRDTIPRRGMKPGEKVSVELWFRLGNRDFRIVRTRSNAELFQGDEVLANSAKAVTQRVESLLGMNRTEFFNTYFTGQKDLAAMKSMGGPTERGRFLSRVLGYDRLRDAQELLRGRRNSAKSELTGLLTGMPDADELKGALAEATARFEAATARHEAAVQGYSIAHARVEELAPVWRSAEEIRTAWVGLEGELRQAESKVEGARQNFTRLDGELLRANEARQRLDALAPSLAGLPAMLEERDRLDQVATAVTARSEALARRNQVMHRRADIDAKLVGLPTAADVESARNADAAALAAATEAESRHAERHTRWTADRQEAEGELNRHRDQFRELEKALEQLRAAGPAGICPTCKRPLGDNAAATITMLQTQLEDVRANGLYLRQRSDQLKVAPQDVQALDAGRQRAAATAREATAHSAKVSSAFEQRSELDAELVALAAELASLDSQLTGPVASYDSDRHEELRARIRELEPVRSE
ncbi:MAG TPA: SMC family ATPase, partial [Gemmatimonadales bacterium]|nr:SMC family ATPase [Gemmatimonadales bacterium]